MYLIFFIDLGINLNIGGTHISKLAISIYRSRSEIGLELTFKGKIILINLNFILVIEYEFG